jgi:acyl-CoA dehydrogenase
MNDLTSALSEAVAAACERHATATAEPWHHDLWSALEQIGVTLLSVPEQDGGAGADLVTTVAVLELMGRYSARIPLAETCLQAGWLLSETGFELPAGPMTATVAGPDARLERHADGWRLSGSLSRVPWARYAEHCALLIEDYVVLLPCDRLLIHPGSNLAGEPRDTIELDALLLSTADVRKVPTGSLVTAEAFHARGALGRTATMAGAARRALELSVSYSAQREQFGRPLNKFQAVQQNLAVMAGQVLLCKVASEAMARALDTDEGWALSVAAGKCISSQAATIVAKIAHQVHGAIGFTDEHELRLSTTRLWSWRDEEGTQRQSAGAVGDLVTAGGPDRTWSLICGG